VHEKALISFALRTIQIANESKGKSVSGGGHNAD
jgi:hypothetical protein